MLQTWKNIVLNWTNCYFTESLEKEQSLTVESLQSIISHLRENINLDESKSSTLEAFSIEEFLSEKYPEFKFENGTVEPNNEDEYYLVASLLLFFVCTNSKDLDIKNAMCSKLSTHDQEVILKYSKTLMEVPEVKYKDVHASILEACQEIVAAPPRSIISETPPSLRSLHSEVRRLQAALDAERFDRNFLQEELSRNNSRLEKLSKEKELFKLEILNLKAKISLCCGQEKSTPSQSGDINSTIYAKQVQDLEDRLVHTQEQLEDAQYERESYRTKINELKQEREKWHLLNQELATQVDQLQEELDTEKRLSQSYRELVYELRIHNQRNCLDNSQLEWDDLEASFHIIPPHNTSNTSEDGVKPNLSHEIVTLKEELHSKLLIEIEQMKTQNSNINSLLKKEIERNEQSYKEHLLENQQMLRKYEELTALKDATVLELQNKNVMIENLQKSITEKSKLVEDLQCDLASLNNTVKEQNINISSMQEVIDELRTEIKQLLENESYLQDCNKNNIADIEGKLSHIKTLTEQMTLNANAKAKLEEEVQCLNHELINLRQEQSHADFQLQSLKEEHNKLELRYNKQIEKSNQELVDLESKLQEETSKCSILQEQQNIVKNELDFNKLKVSDLLKEIKLKENEILSFKNEIEHLLNDLEKCKNLLHGKVETIDKLEFEVRELKEGFENKNKKIDSLEKINGKLEHENKIIKDLFETEKNMSYRIIEEKQKQIDNLMVELSQTNSLVENIKSKLQEETSKCSILQEQHNNVEKELEDKRSRNLDLLQEIKVKTTEYLSLENELQKRNNEIYDKDEIINKLSIEVRESKDSIENKIEEFNSLRQINVTLENEIKTIKDLLQTEKITYNKVKEEKQKCIEDLMVELSQTNSAVENIKSILNEEYNKFSILQEQQNNVEKELEDKRSMNLDLLKEVKVKETDILSLENELQKCRNEIHDKQKTINKLLLEVRESKDCIENKIKEFDSIRQLNVTLENESKIIKDLLKTEKITSEEKQKNIEDLMEELNQTNSLVENVKSRLEEETIKCSTLQEQLNNVGKELDDMKSKILDLLQDNKDKETEIVSLKNEKDNLSEHLQMCKRAIHDKDGTINKLLLEVGELKENIENKNKEFESVNIKLENENKIINDLLETEKHTSYKIIEEKQKHIENIMAELSQTNDIIQKVKKENNELSQALNDERIEKTKISKDKEELGHENKILIDLLETVKKTARSTINEKQSQIEKLLQEVDDKYKSIQILDTEKGNLQSVIDQNREENKALKDVLEREKNNSSSTINEKQSQIDKLLNEMHSKDKSIQILNEDKRNLQSCIVQKEEEIAAHEKHIVELNQQNKIFNDVATVEKISVQNVLREKESKIAELMEKLDSVSRERQELIANIAIFKQQINAKEETINELSETEKRLQKLLLQNAQDKITINYLSQQIEACNSQLVDTNEEVKRLTDLSNTQKQQIEDKERIILELITEKDVAILALNKYILEEKESKDNLVNELESKNIMIQNLQESIEEKIKLVEDTQDHLESLNITIKEHNDKITSSKEAIDELESEKNRLLQNESHLQESNQNYSADVESNLLHIKGLTEQITLNANAKANLEKEVQYLNHELISLRKELSAKDFKLKSLKDEYNKLELKYNEQIEKNNLLFIESEKKLKQESNKCFTLQEQQNNFKTEFDAKTSKISELLQEVETKKTEIVTLKNERDHLANNLQKCENELLDKDETIKKLLFEVREINEGIESKIKEFDSLGQLNVKLEQENKINKDLLQTEKTTSHRIIEEKQKQIEDLTVELSQTNSVVENVKSKLEEETSKFSILQEQQNNVVKELEDKKSNILDLLQEIKVKETEVLTLKNEKNNIWDTLQKCKNEIHDKAETINKLSLEVRELKENIEIKNKEFESLEKLNVKLESDYKIIKDSLETEKHMSHTIIEEKQLKIDNIMAELNETKSLIEDIKKENYESSEALNNVRKEKTSISKDKEELIQENKTLKDLLEAEKSHASSSINEKQSQIDKLLNEIHSKDKAIQILEEQKQNLQTVIVQYQEENGAIKKRIFELENQNKILNDGAKVEKDSLQNVLQDKENKIAQLKDNLESVSRERLELFENIAMFKQQISVYEAKINDLTEMENRLQKLLLENSQYMDTINDLKEQIVVCNAQINNNKSNEEVKRLTDMLNTQKEQINDRDSIILKLITEKDAVIGAMSKELLEEKDTKDKLLRELDSKNIIVSELKLQISELKKEEMMNCLRRENDELIKAVGQRETLLMASQEKSGSKSNNSEKQHRMYIQVDNSALLDNTQSSLDSYKTISDLEKIIHDKNRTITTLQSDLTYIKSLMAESENKLLDVSKELEIQKEISDQLSSQLKKIVNQKNDEIADLKKQLNKMSVTENRASEIIKLSAKYQAIILKRIAEIKTNTVLKELQNFGNSATSEHELRRLHAGSVTMDDLENFLETTERHLKRFSEKQIALQKERDRLHEVTRINESEIIGLKKFLTELSLSFKTFSSVKEVYTQKLSKVVAIQRTVRREILNSEGHITDAAMCKLERGYAAVMQDLAETVLNIERWVERCLGRTISPEKIKQAFTSDLDRYSLSSSSYQNTGLEVQLEELEKSFQKLLEEVSQSRRGEGSKDAQSVTVMEVRAEYEDKLNRMKAKMKQLFEEQIAKFKEKQKKEISDLNMELDKAKESLAESSKAYEEHIRALTTELWSVGEKFLIQKDEAEWLRKKQRSGSLMSLQHYHSAGLGVAVEEPVGRPSDTASLRSLPVIPRNSDVKTNKKREGRGLHMSDEEGEVFDNRCLKELTSTPRAPSNSGKRLSELQWRNSLCPPHLKSSYPAETQFAHSVHEEDIKHSLGAGFTLPGRNQRKEVGITAYKKPGPPTPSKQAGRLSATDSELRESLRVEMNPHASRKTGTPSRLRALFRSTRNDTSDNTPRRRLSNIFRKK